MWKSLLTALVDRITVIAAPFGADSALKSVPLPDASGRPPSRQLALGKAARVNIIPWKRLASELLAQAPADSHVNQRAVVETHLRIDSSV
ncbi:hypothetical protein [Deinococcus hopiensis]|uniref:Uncharacterized protein n=1 Tax=Deinococcus hopiensis KR-140 TaxID=695939 RepID=A0A1W1VDU8_9DEIO|nr:hypothetical protein [Deinococcus hopiensis]SMB91548.1 hypothetical protein SAMN00790413_01183 [Deinococcus hopiensis KR-140]